MRAALRPDPAEADRPVLTAISGIARSPRPASCTARKRPMRPEKMNRYGWLGRHTDTLVPDGDLWHGAGPIAVRAITDGVEELIRLLQERE